MTTHKKQQFFTLKKYGSRWLFVSPNNEPFFSIGLNHIDYNAMKNERCIDRWRDKYCCSSEKWICEEVTSDLTAWGFNTIGWVQDVVVIDSDIHRHSANWTLSEYKSADMPFCHLLPFTQTHQWDVETLRPDVFSKGFEEWCDYVAKRDCLDMADEPNLVGYFFSDCPNWLHPSLNSDRIGPWFDPELLTSEIGNTFFCQSVERYYSVITKSIRRYDKRHLILGDRLEGCAPLPDELLLIAARYVDALCFQYFGSSDNLVRDFRRWHRLTSRPILLADASAPGRRHRDEMSITPLDEGLQYARCLERYFLEDYFIGWHYCGSFIKNTVRRHGLKDEYDNPRTDLTNAMTEVNRRILSQLSNMEL